ncbi:MAG TPA: hypothetical protein VE134_07420, partial [Methanomicrobiales archaeon]|nr:hypothetical protein [Methanomicrobiales archaeon]
MPDDYYAFSEISSAIDRTKALLWPPRPEVWLVLAVIVLFTAGAGVSSPFQYNMNRNELPPGTLASLLPFMPFVLLLIGVLIALFIVFFFLSSVFQFVFIDSLASGRVAILPYFRGRVAQGLRLFAFLAIFVLAFLAIFAALFLLLLWPVIASGTASPFAIIPAVLSFLAIFIVLMIPFGLVMMFTIDFVVPMMVRDDLGVIDAWRQLCPMLQEEWKQALVYIIAKVVLGIAAAILVAILALLALLLIGLPFLGIGLLLAALLAVPNITIFLVLLIPFLILFIPAVLL